MLKDDIMPDYISVVDTAARWGISPRRITVLCLEGRVPGAFLIGNSWVIPANAEKPADARIKSGKYIKKPCASMIPKDTVVNPMGRKRKKRAQESKADST